MPENHHIGEQESRIAALEAFELSLKQSANVAIASLGDLSEPIRFAAALRSLIRSGRFDEAASLASGREPHPKWCELGVYANATLSDFEAARTLIRRAEEEFDGVTTQRCRLAFAEAVFGEVLKVNGRTTLTAAVGLSEEKRAALQAAIDVLQPLLNHVRAVQEIPTPLQYRAIEYATRAYGMAGQLTEIADLVSPLRKYRPVPLILGQLALQRICEPPRDLVARLRIEYPTTFGAHFMAALLEREFGTDHRKALESFSLLREMAKQGGRDYSTALCEAVFETAAAIDKKAVGLAREVILDLQGSPNEWEILLDSVAAILEGQPQLAIALLQQNPRKEEAVWWQILAKAQETAGLKEEATNSLQQACAIVPHPAIVNHFAGLSLQQNRFAHAAIALESALELTPHAVPLLEQLAMAYVSLRRFTDAAGTFRRLIVLRPAERRHRYNLAISLARSGSVEEALEILRPLLNPQEPELDVLGVQCEILNSVGRPKEAFALLRASKKQLWHDQHFRLLYMSTAFRAGQEGEGTQAFAAIVESERDLPEDDKLFQTKTLDEAIEIFTAGHRERLAAASDVLNGKLPWLFADALFGIAAVEAWARRTNDREVLSDDPNRRQLQSIYATNGFTVLTSGNDKRQLRRIQKPEQGEAVVVDFSALLTLHQLGLLEKVIAFCGRIILPSTYGDLRMRDGARLTGGIATQEKLNRIRTAIDQRAIAVIDDAAAGSAAIVDEHSDDAATFALADLQEHLRTSQSLTDAALADFATKGSRLPSTDRMLADGQPLCFTLETLRLLVSSDWFGQLLATRRICLSRQDNDRLLAEIASLAQAAVWFDTHNALWDELNRLRHVVEFRSCDRMHSLRVRRDEQDEPPPYFDAALLALDLKLPLLADDRVNQAHALNLQSELPSRAFGTDRMLVSLHRTGAITRSERTLALLQLMRWKYRFVLMDAADLVSLARRSRKSLPGSELLAVAAYVQDSMRDPGLFGGLENADPPMSMAIKLFMKWVAICSQFIASLWKDPEFDDEELVVITGWILTDLLPMVPKQLHGSGPGIRLTAFVPSTVLSTAMIHFATVQPLERANKALRLIAQSLCLSDDQFFEAAASVAGRITHE